MSEIDAPREAAVKQCFALLTHASEGKPVHICKLLEVLTASMFALAIPEAAHEELLSRLRSQTSETTRRLVSMAKTAGVRMP